jgi:hypothetical protein
MPHFLTKPTLNVNVSASLIDGDGSDDDNEDVVERLATTSAQASYQPKPTQPSSSSAKFSKLNSKTQVKRAPSKATTADDHMQLRRSKRVCI